MDKKLLAKLIAGIFGTAPFLSVVNPVLAAGTDVAQYPLANRRSSDIKPNIMLVMDDSGTMAFDYMPDSAGLNDVFGPGYRSHLCNTIYYNPNPSNANVPMTPYLVPRAPVSGTSVDLNDGSPTSFASAYDNGYWSYDQIGVAGGVPGRTVLSADQGISTGYDGAADSLPGYISYRSGQAAYYWKYLGSGAVTPTSGACTTSGTDTSNFATATGLCGVDAADESGTYTVLFSAYAAAAEAAAAAAAAATTSVARAAAETLAATAGDAACALANPLKPKLIWQKKRVSSTSSTIVDSTSGINFDETLRFANWYTYYRTRMQMVKSAIGRAFMPLVVTDKYRAGFITIAPQQLDNGVAKDSVYHFDDLGAWKDSKFLEIGNFHGSTQSTSWFSILYAQRPNGGTPLREGLSRVGRYYAGGKQPDNLTALSDGPNKGMIVPPGRPDPVQYACQQNFAILTTDGYWNVPPTLIPGMANHGGFKIDFNQKMDNQDGNIGEADAYGLHLTLGARPIYDGTATSTDTFTDAMNAFRQTGCTNYLQTDLQILKSTNQNLQSTEQNLQSMRQALQSTNQNLRNTWQNLQDTTQIWQSTAQALKSTNQNLQSTNQDKRSTAQVSQVTTQNLKSTNQNKQSTNQNKQSTRQVWRDTNQYLKSSYQNLQSTYQVLQTTTQILQTRLQNLQSTNQNRQSTNQNRQSTRQISKTTTQNLKSTAQNLQNTNQNLASTTQISRITTQNLKSTDQILKSTNQNLQSTAQLLQTATQNRQSTNQILKSTNQNLRSTAQASQTTTQVRQSTNQNLQSTYQVQQSTYQAVKATSQTRQCNWAGGACQPKATCTVAFETTTCSTITASPSVVSSCTPTDASSANSWITTTCPASISTGPTSVPSCTSAAGAASNSWITTTCTPTITTSVPVNTCTSASASSANSWVTTTCPAPIVTTSVAVASCTSASASGANSWITTTCAAPSIVTAAAASCTSAAASSANSWITTTCANSTTISVPAVSCTSAAASSANSWITTTCAASTTISVPAVSCTSTAASSANSWIATTCANSATTSVPVASCTSAGASSTNSWIATTCPAPSVVTGATSSCTSASAAASNSWIATTCANSTTTSVPVATCTSASASASNGWITITCPAPSVTSNVPASACTSAGPTSANSWIATTCPAPSVTSSVAVASCTSANRSSANSWIRTTCPAPVVTSAAVLTCTSASATSLNSWIATACPTSTATNVAVATCSNASATSANSWIATTCPSAIVGTNVPIQNACTSASATSLNSWITTTCPSASITSSVPIATCSAAGGTSANSWITTTCPGPVVTSAAIASCTSAAATSANSWIATNCTSAITSNVGVASCTSAGASSANSWITTTCPAPIVTSSVAIQNACVSAGASSANSWITTTCPGAIVTTSVPVASCTSANATSANNWITTTCAVSIISSSPILTCTPASATSANGWVSTSCSTITTGPVGVQTCSVASATSANSWIATGCPAPSVTTSVAVLTCTSASASSANSWITTTCPAPIVTNSVAIQNACTSAAASSANNWITTTCPAPIVTSVALATCTSALATSANGWVTTNCSSITTTSVAIATCTSASASSANSWITTTCANSATISAPVFSCTSASASSANSWITTTCPAPSVTSSVAVVSCTSANATSANLWIATTCPAPVVTSAPVASCTSAGATSANSWIATNCPASNTTSIAVASCTSASASSANSWITTTCANSATISTPVSSCTSASASSANSWITTTCPAPSVTSSVAVASCTSANATSANSWIATTCPAPVVTSVPIGTCISASAASGNSWVTTNCGTSTTISVPVASCTAAGATSGNSWIATACPSAIVGTNVPIQNACVSANASSANSWITTTCPGAIVTTSVPVASCTSANATSGNSWITTTCPAAIVSISVPVAACTSAAASSGNSWITTTCVASTTSSVPVATCTSADASSGNSWITTTCPAPIVTTNVPAASCTSSNALVGNSWIATFCDTTSSPLNQTITEAQSCTSASANAGNSWVSTTCVAQAAIKNQYQTQTRSRVDRYSDTVLIGSTTYPAWSADWSSSFPAAGWVDMSQCLASPPAGGWPGYPANYVGQPSSSNPAGPVAAPAIPYYQSFDAACTGWPCKHTVTPAAGGCDTATAANTANGLGGSCGSLADVAHYYYKTDLRPSFSNNTIADTSTRGPIEGDVAGWQHMTTFTMGLGVSGNVAYNADYTKQPVNDHVTAGIPDEDFQKIRCWYPNISKPLGWTVGTPNGDPNLCLNWPAPVAEATNAVDDLWHAAVNGRGQYFSAADPDSVFTGLQTALKAIEARGGAGTGSTTATQDPIEGNNLTFKASYVTVEWTGDIVAQHLYTGANTCEVSVAACTAKKGRLTGSTCSDGKLGCDLSGTTQGADVWSAKAKLVGVTSCDDRNIYLLRTDVTASPVSTLAQFAWDSLTRCPSATSVVANGLNDTEKAFFTSDPLASPPYSAPFNMTSWTQYDDMLPPAPDQRQNAQGKNLVNFLRGQTGMEGFVQGSPTKLFRRRTSILGDIIGSQPRYVSTPLAQFTDTGYALYKQDQSGRAPMLYVGANDGMLHAFKVGGGVIGDVGGEEAWAVIPSAVLPNLYRLANTGYSDKHRFFVDSTPSAGDVYDKYKMEPSTLQLCSHTDVKDNPAKAKNCWKTILVGGLGGGGRGYYALDVSNPSGPPTALWEFKQGACYDTSTAVTTAATNSADCHLGLSVGVPMITKLTDGTWVAIVSSGIGNDDGKGYLYVLDAITGKIIKRILVSPGTPANPADFAYINAYVENFLQDNTTERIYGGDMLGNVWRVDLTSLSSTAGSADVVKLATLIDPSGNPQPITTTPQLMNVGAASTRMVYVGTGRYLGEADLTDTPPPQVQTVWGLAEDLALNSTSAAYIANGNSVLPTAPLTLRHQLNKIVLSTVYKTVTDPVSGATSTVPDYRTAASPICSSTGVDIANGAGCVGWYADLPATGERVNLDMRLALGSLTVITNVPLLASCDSGGSGWRNVFDATTGGAVNGSEGKVGQAIAGAVAVGTSLIRDQFGRILSIITKSDGSQEVSVVPTQQAAPLGRRSSWRDLLN